jgi:hypothetical protein
MQPWTNVETSLPPPDGRTVPARPEDLNAEWLTACLHHAGALAPDARVASFQTTRIGEGFAGQLARVELDYEPQQAAAPRALIAKFASDHLPTREMMTGIDGYVREVRFYRELASEIGVSTPRCYLAHYDGAQGRFCLLLEDLSPARSADLESGLSIAQTELVLDQLAALHARWWGRANEVEWLRLSLDFIKRVRDHFLASLPGFLRRYGDKYPELARVATQMGELLSGDELLASLQRPPLTLVHNDLHIENVFLPTEAGGRFALIDWQSLSASRHGTTDVTRVLCMGLRPELRRRHGDALLRHYHAKLRSLGVRGFSLRRLRRRFKEEMTSMAIIGVMAFDTLDFEVEGGPVKVDLLGRRVEAALRDAGVSRLLLPMLVGIRIRRWLRRILLRTGLLGPNAR